MPNLEILKMHQNLAALPNLSETLDTVTHTNNDYLSKFHSVDSCTQSCSRYNFIFNIYLKGKH